MRSAESYVNDLRTSREAKRRRHGTCERCGNPTRYGGQKGKPAVSRLCGACGRKESAEREHARIGTGPTQQRVLALLRERSELRFTELRDEMGWTNAATGARLARWLRYGLIERVCRGVYRAADAAESIRSTPDKTPANVGVEAPSGFEPLFQSAEPKADT